MYVLMGWVTLRTRRYRGATDLLVSFQHSRERKIHILLAIRLSLGLFFVLGALLGRLERASGTVALLPGL